MSCPHARIETVTTYDDAPIARRCVLCLSVWASRACAVCSATFDLVDRRSLRRQICERGACQRERRNARDRARRARKRDSVK